jgi:hypothetical protein
MGGTFSQESRDDDNTITQRKCEPESVNIKLSCTDFGTFNGKSDNWTSFKENILSKACVGGYAQYFQQDFHLNENKKEWENRIFYLLQNATNGGGASHVVRKHLTNADGNGAWDWHGTKDLSCPERLLKHYIQSYGRYV